MEENDYQLNLQVNQYNQEIRNQVVSDLNRSNNSNTNINTTQINSQSNSDRKFRVDGYGIDRERIFNKTGFEEELICCICQNIFVSPITCANCENQFCTKCINDWTRINGKKICPNKCELILKKSPPITKGILSKLKFYCIFKENGCNTIIDYDNVITHETNCDFQLELCSGCNKDFLKKEIKTHQENCDELMTTCNICSFTTKIKEFSIHDKIFCTVRRIETMEEKMTKMTDRLSQLELYKANTEKTINILQSNNTCLFCKEIKRCKVCIGCKEIFCEDCTNNFVFCEYCEFNFDNTASTLTGEKAFISNKKASLKDGVLIGNKLFNKGVHQWNVKLIENGCTCESSPSSFGIIKSSRLKNCIDFCDAITNKSTGVANKGYLFGMEGKVKPIKFKEKYTLCLNFDNNTFTITGDSSYLYSKLITNSSYYPFFGCCSGTIYEIEVKHTFY